MEFIKELFKTKRGRAILKLCGYIIFFAIVILMFRTSGDGSNIPISYNKETKTPIQIFDDMTNYEYLYNRNGTIINGKVYRDNMYFTLNDNTYYVNNKIYLIKDNDKEEIDDIDKLYLINNHDISKYIEHSTLVSKNENYEEGITENKYHIDSEYVIYDVNNMYVTLYEQNNNIFKVLIEMDKDKIEIEYKKIGKVSNFTLDYE